jgi:hypothetical protein
MTSSKTKSDLFTTSSQEIWKGRIRSERDSGKQWSSNWGFLVEARSPDTVASESHHSASKALFDEFVSESSVREAYRVCDVV